MAKTFLLLMSCMFGYWPSNKWTMARQLCAGLAAMFVLLGVSNAQASCDFPAGKVKQVLFLKEEDCELAESIAEVINGVARLYPEYSPVVNLKIGGPSDNATFDEGRAIQIPYQLKYYSQYGQESLATRSQLLAVVAHEYGHAILHEYHFKKLFPKQAGLHQALDELSRIRFAVLTEKQLHEVMEKAVELRYLPDFKNYEALNPIAEYFADAVAVFYYQDLTIITKALYFDEMTDRDYQYIKMRDFSAEPNLRYKSLIEEDHNRLAYARAYLGIYKYEGLKKDRTVFLQNFLQAIGDSILKVWGKPEFTQDTQKLNALIIEKLNKI